MLYSTVRVTSDVKIIDISKIEVKLNRTFHLSNRVKDIHFRQMNFGIS